MPAVWVRTNRASYFRRRVSPVIHLLTRRFFLTRACRACQFEKTGRGCLLDNRGALRPQETRAGLLEDLLGPLDLTVRGLPFGTRVRRFWARPAFRDPPLPRRSTRTGSTWDALFASRDRRNARHCCGTRDGDRAPRPPGRPPPTGFNPGAGRCHVRCWIQTPRQGSGTRIIGTVRTTGDKRDQGKHAGYAASIKEAQVVLAEATAQIDEAAARTHSRKRSNRL
jgi:hypothetical protein